MCSDNVFIALERPCFSWTKVHGRGWLGFHGRRVKARTKGALSTHCETIKKAKAYRRKARSVRVLNRTRKIIRVVLAAEES